MNYNKAFCSTSTFLSRCGKCVEILSYYGTTIGGANYEIQTVFKESGVSIGDIPSDDGVQYNFISPHAPHFCGLREALKTSNR